MRHLVDYQRSLPPLLVTLLLTLTPAAAVAAPPETSPLDRGSRASPQPINLPSAAPRLVLITLDGVRWQDVVGLRARHLPALQRHFARGGLLLGGSGAEVRVANPSVVSLPGYRELLTGKVDPTCNANRCDPLAAETLLDLAAQSPNSTVAVVASWSGLRHATSASPLPPFLRSAGRGDPLSEALGAADPEVAKALVVGESAKASPGLEDYRPDRYTAAAGLAVLDTLRPTVLLIGLGDTDEWAHRGNKRAYYRALEAADRLVGAVVERVDAQDGCDTAAPGPCASSRTTIVVTTDHGRSRSFRHHGGAPEAARIWLAVRGPRFGGASVPAGTVAAADLAPTLATLLGLDSTVFEGGGDSLRFATSWPVAP